MKTTKLYGALLAAAVGAFFAAHPVLANEQKAETGQVKCLGGNGCAGQSSCKTATSPGPGKNSCAHQGFVMASNAKECEAMGGHVKAQAKH